MSDPQIGLSYWRGAIPDEVAADFASAVSSAGLRVDVRSQEPPIRAGIEWLLPTAVVVYLVRPYLDGFLGEMGKDHYALLKRLVAALGQRLLHHADPEVVMVTTSGAVSTGDVYSLAFSVVARIGEHRRVKLLVPKAASESDIAAAIDAFFALLLDADALESTVREYETTTIGADPVLVFFDSKTATLRIVDPGPRKRRREA